MERSADQQRILREQGEQVHILELQGYLFFGTATNLLKQTQARLDDAARALVRFLVLDFRRVTGIDSSAVFSFTKLLHLAEARDMTLIVTEASPRVKKALLGAASGGADAKTYHFFPDLDRGVEWC
jgi:SulP family sulfate permease